MERDNTSTEGEPKMIETNGTTTYSLETLAKWAETNARSVGGDDSAPFVVADEATWKQVAAILRRAADTEYDQGD